MLRRWQRRLRYWWTSGDRARLLDEEMQFHLDMKIHELMEDGMKEPDARAAARRQLGNLMRQQEDARDTWIARWLSDLLQDTVFALRTIRKQPGFAAAASLSAALGIGACSLIFGIANHALLRPLPVDEPSRLVSLTGRSLRSGRSGGSLAYPDFADLRQAHSFQALTAFFPFMPAAIASGGEPRRYWGSVVTANYFDVVRPAFSIGRGFNPDRDDKPGEAPVVVLGHQLWQSRFSADPSILGQSIVMNGQRVTVIGVTAPGFQGTESMFYSDFWLPFSMLDSLAQVGMGGDRLHSRGSQWLLAAGRLRGGISLSAAASEVEAVGHHLTTAYPATNRDRAFHIERAGQVNPGFRKAIVLFFFILLTVAGLILCTACANVANLLLARASARHREIATRLAIGAGRVRLIRQLLTESLMLALLGGLGGYAIAHIGVTALSHARIPLAMPVDFSIALDYRVLLFCVALSALTGVIFGAVPAWRATKPDLVGSLKDEQVRLGASRRFGLRNILVVAQVTICMVLLLCSGLFLRSLNSASHIDPGFTHRSLLIAAFDPSLNRYTAAQTRHLLDALLENASAIQGVESVTLGNSIPLNLEGTQNAFVPEDKLADKESSAIKAHIYSVAPRFFETFGIRMLEGADFPPGEPQDDTVIVNQALAAKAFPNQNPIGRRISYLGRMVRITGLVATTKSRTIGEEPTPCLYFPLMKDLRGNDSLSGISLIIRTKGDPAAYAPLLRQTFRNVDPTLAVFDVRTMETQLAQALLLPKAAALLFGFAGLMGLLISTVGIYGVISFGVARRTKEIGIRMALGARRTQVLGMILRQGLLLTLTGSAIGLCVALALSRVAASLLYGVSPTDTLTFLLIPALLVSIALTASVIPARRAASLDPLRALRYE
ncbi:ABC transporter permease [uncultured Paludibaculum sp.]|uniref:ABC transporter permease n=1 Tax=uncultured Paludibaculum sp. TaxID=1765020 RepID=UPI002AAB79A1|nr:ABC transporter permease [uncultured Paludibaculum sp.]